ncbi:MAG: glycosyltransferase family 2 protein [Candidatus Sumerlaeota bacterium]|nr:glycosyltransferase family 2 protein [Candidatus Sumerlaeota bacterium]
MTAYPESPAFSVVVPNWNGEAYLRRGLGSLFLSARSAGRPFEIIVVDDASDDQGPALVEREYPAARLIRQPENRGFGETVNEGVRQARGPIVVLANNDLIVREEFIPRLLEAMEGERVFAASALTVDWDRGEPNHVEMFAVWREGLIAQQYAHHESACETVFVQGGACAIRRDEFLAMGGFSPLFAPGYWEDYDLAYWARKKGWRVLYEPRAVANHLGKASLAARYGRDELEILRRRNQVLFTWLNLTDGRLWARHLVELPAAVASDLARGENSPLAKGFVRALPKIPAALRERRRRRPTFRLRDSEILRSPRA